MSRGRGSARAQGGRHLVLAFALTLAAGACGRGSAQPPTRSEPSPVSAAPSTPSVTASTPPVTSAPSTSAPATSGSTPSGPPVVSPPPRDSLPVAGKLAHRTDVDNEPDGLTAAF